MHLVLVVFINVSGFPGTVDAVEDQRIGRTCKHGTAPTECSFVNGIDINVMFPQTQIALREMLSHVGQIVADVSFEYV